MRKGTHPPVSSPSSPPTATLPSSAMPHLCRICSRTLANEMFSGRGHRDHVCRECQRLPRSTRDSIGAESKISGFLTDQSRISEKNIVRLRFHCSSLAPDIVRLAGAVLPVALVLPFRRKRFSKLHRDHPHLPQELGELGLKRPPAMEPESARNIGLAVRAMLSMARRNDTAPAVWLDLIEQARLGQVTGSALLEAKLNLYIKSGPFAFVLGRSANPRCRVLGRVRPWRPRLAKAAAPA